MIFSIVAILIVLFTIAWFAARMVVAKNRGTLAFERGGLFAPWSVNLLHWIVIIAMIVLIPNSLKPLTSRFWVSIILWIAIFCPVSYFVYSAIPTSPDKRTTDFTLSKFGYNALLLIAVVLTTLYLVRIYHQLMQMGVTNWMADIRKLALQDRDNGAVAYCIVIDQVLFVASMFAGTKVPLWKRLLATILFALCGLSVMEKGIFVFMILVWLFTYYERGVINKKHLLAVGTVVVVLASVFTIMRNGREEKLHEKNSFVEFYEVYLMASPVAYCYMPDSPPREPGGYTFAFFYYIANKLHLGGPYYPEPRLQPFIKVPVDTNTYTVLQPFYLDFGYGGVAFFAFVYAVLFGICYRHYRNGNPLFALLYGYMIALFCLQFHQEEIFSGLMRLVQYVFFGLIVITPIRIPQKHE